MTVTYDFTGQVALVTGAASGMGLDTGRAFAAAGAAVVLADRDADAVHAAAEQLNTTDATTIGVRCDVADEHDVAGMVERASPNSGGSTWPSTTPASWSPRATPLTNRSKCSNSSTPSTSAACGHR